MNPGCGDIVPRIEIARPLHMDSVAGSWRLHLKKTDLPDAAPSVYVVDEEGRLRGSVPLVRLALADPAVRLWIITSSEIRRSSLCCAAWTMARGTNCPVVDSEGRYWEAVFRKPLLMNLLIGGISAGEALPGFLESRWAQVGVEWLM
jgi:hypothetical protein